MPALHEARNAKNEIIEKLKELDPFAIEVLSEDFRRHVKELNPRWADGRIRVLE